MGLLGSLIKATVKVAVTPVALAGDVLTSGAFSVTDGGTLTERATKGLGKDFKKISKGIDKL